MERSVDRHKDITGVVQDDKEGREEEEECAGEVSDRPGEEMKGREDEVGKGGWHVFDVVGSVGGRAARSSAGD